MTTMAASALISPLALRGSTNLHTEAKQNARSLIIRCSKLRGAPELSSVEGPRLNQLKRRDVFGLLLGVSCVTLNFEETKAAGLPPEEKPKLCDDVCEKELENVGLLVALCCCFLSIKKLQIEVPMVTTESGLQYKDIKVGNGPSPPIGFQVAANYVAMVPSGQIFDSSLEKNQLYIFRVGSGQVIKGLDEGLLSMKAGGKRRLYIPGPLAFPKGLTSAPGRPRVAPNSPVVFDVSLEYIPGLESEEE